ncbi:MAG: hypothetical protein E7345_04920 [Clostridiales bacterium]|nr:hypothetical protein [Clostridiales bacterium]
MAKKTKRKTKSNSSARKRIGTLFIAILSVGITVLISVGATLAYFAGSTTASNSLYMGGPVYVEMTGRNNDFLAGNGNLDVSAFVGRTTGTAGTISNTILLPGQKVEIHSSARVYSTTETSTVEDNPILNPSTGANTGNIGNAYTDSEGNAYYVNNEGRVTSTTTSIVRARFGIDIEFDPSVGFNNFTGTSYSNNYPVQSQTSFVREETNTTTETVSGFEGAIHSENATYSYDPTTQVHTGRRDYVSDNTFTSATTAGEDMNKIKSRQLKSIYSWKYVSQAEYEGSKAITDDTHFAKMPAPFDGTVNSQGTDSNKVPGGNGNGFYAVWILDGAGNKTESNSFYKARTIAYMNTYVESYVNEYGNTVTRTLQSSIDALNASLNNYFVSLINDSSTYIQTADDTGTTDVVEGLGMNASWLYIDPAIGNDTNSNEISTTVGGWWYLIVDNGGTISGEKETYADTPPTGITVNANDITQNVNRNSYEANNPNRLKYYLYEIIPDIELGEVIGTNGQKKIASDTIPFVNGTFALPSDSLTNVFANAKLSFQVSFQALQAFLPYTSSIDNIDYTNPLLGTGKPLTIENAIPIYNEAFDYQESGGEIGGY